MAVTTGSTTSLGDIERDIERIGPDAAELDDLTPLPAAPTVEGP